MFHVYKFKGKYAIANASEDVSFKKWEWVGSYNSYQIALSKIKRSF